MKKNLFLTALMVSLLTVTAFLFLKAKSDEPVDVKSLMTKTAYYIQEARNTGNFDYYNKAALDNIEKVLEKDPKNFDALMFKGTILLSQHRFERAFELAEQARLLYPYSAYVYGLLVDANIELGKYDQAIEAADKMVSARPDLRSYSRIAYLREIHGDIPGAIEAMKMAVDAGTVGDENTEWCRVRVAKLHEQLGEMKHAEMYYTIALQNRENYPYALAGMAGIAASEKNYEKALTLYLQADSLIPDHQFKEGIAEMYSVLGKKKESNLVKNEILEYMKKYSGDPSLRSGQNEDHELAHAYLGIGDAGKALEYALLEYNRRPGNIEVNETVAKVYYEKGDYEKAVPFIERALRTNNKKPELLNLARSINDHRKIVNH